MRASLDVAIPVLRGWTDPTGEEWVTLSPIALAIVARLRTDERPATLKTLADRVHDLVYGDGELTVELITATAAHEQTQRACGYTGP